MKTIILNEETYRKLFNESRGVPNNAINDTKSILNDFLNCFHEMYDLAVELETEHLSTQNDEDDEWWDDSEWEDNFEYDFNSSGYYQEYHIDVFYDSSSRIKAQTDTDGEITINFAPIKTLIDRDYERYTNINQKTIPNEILQQTIVNYLYPIILHELTHDTDEVGGNHEHIWIGQHHRLNEEDLREILYFFADGEMNARISSSYALMSNYLTEMLINPDLLRNKQITTQEVYDMIQEMMADNEEELHINHMDTLVSLMKQDIQFADKKYIQRSKDEKRHPYSLPYDLYLNDNRLKRNRNLKRLFTENYKAAVMYVCNFYNKLIEQYKDKILRTSIKAVQDYMENEEKCMKKLDNIITESINKYLKENLENEYLDRYYGIPLKRYFNMSDKDKDNERILQYFYKFYDFLYEKDLIEPLSDEECTKIQNACFEDNGEVVMDIINNQFDDNVKKDFAKWLRDNNDFNTVPTYDVMDYTRDVHNEWLIHFSDSAAQISYQGFKYATDNMDDLGYSGSGLIQGKTSEGWDFAYVADDCPRDGNKYGSDAVMFQASGIKATHYGDEEEQVMFWNKDAKNLVLIQNGKGSYKTNSHGDYVSDWFITSTITDEVLYDDDDIRNVIQWVENNFAQYHKHLIAPRESKMRHNSMQDSSHTSEMNWRMKNGK